MSRSETIEHTLRAALAPESLAVIDESARHAGHVGARPEGETHFRIEIVSATFQGLTRLERQRLIYGLLAGELAAGLHAVSIQARAPGEA